MGQLDCLEDLLSNMKTFFQCWQELSLAVETFNGYHCPAKFRMRHLNKALESHRPFPSLNLRIIWQGMRDREVTEGI